MSWLAGFLLNISCQNISYDGFMIQHWSAIRLFRSGTTIVDHYHTISHRIHIGYIWAYIYNHKLWPNENIPYTQIIFWYLKKSEELLLLQIQLRFIQSFWVNPESPDIAQKSALKWDICRDVQTRKPHIFEKSEMPEWKDMKHGFRWKISHKIENWKNKVLFSVLEKIPGS